MSPPTRGDVVLLQPATERARLVDALTATVPSGMEGIAEALGIAQRVVLASPEGEPAIADGNRTLLLPERTVVLDGRSWALSVKGAGALVPMYGEPLDDEVGTRELLGESWFGEAPFGGQGQVNAKIALDVTAAAHGSCWNGFALCPVIQVVEVPPEHVRADRFWYRRHRGPTLQEHRLVPSDVRLFHAADHTLGQDPDRVLAAFGVSGPTELDAFLDRMIRTGTAALTLFVRTARESRLGLVEHRSGTLPSPAGRSRPWAASRVGRVRRVRSLRGNGQKHPALAPHERACLSGLGPGFPSGALEGLGYGNVWLDKDSVVAPDGALHFADLEGLEWKLAGLDRSLHEVVREQLEHNLYEVLYGLDTVQRVHERVTGRRLSPAERRRKMALRAELALDGDPFVRAEPRVDGLDLVITTPLRPDSPVVVRLFDF